MLYKLGRLNYNILLNLIIVSILKPTGSLKPQSRVIKSKYIDNNSLYSYSLVIVFKAGGSSLYELLYNAPRGICLYSWGTKFRKKLGCCRLSYASLYLLGLLFYNGVSRQVLFFNREWFENGCSYRANIVRVLLYIVGSEDG